MAIADPGSAHVRYRDAEEEQPITLVARINTTLKAFAPLAECVNFDMHNQDVPLYNSIFRFDDQMLITPHLFATPPGPPRHCYICVDSNYYDEPDAPTVNSIVAAASVVVANGSGEILLHRRTDNDLWALPGGTMEFGESIADTAVREVYEETGLSVVPLYVIAVYSDPKHVFVYDDGEVRQESSVCIACKIIGGDLRISDESTELEFVAPDDIADLSFNQ
ncbi:MAG: NUDIX domain-containing protein [Pseudonocardia sp.]